jgi:uncharacterized protein (UPF0248 family)
MTRADGTTTWATATPRVAPTYGRTLALLLLALPSSSTLCSALAPGISGPHQAAARAARSRRDPRCEMPQRAMLPFSSEEDAVLWKRHGSGSEDDNFEETAALLGRGAKGLKKRLGRLREPTTEGHRRLFGEDDSTLGGADGQPTKARLRTALECVQRVLWDPCLTPSDFTIHYRDRYDVRVLAFPLDAPNDSIQGPERLRALALPQHRILYLKYRRRLVWHRQLKLDRVFGSGIAQPGDAAGGAFRTGGSRAPAADGPSGAGADNTGGEAEATSFELNLGEGSAPALRVQDVVRSYDAWASADAAVRSAAKARARRSLRHAAGRRYGSVEERMGAVGAVLTAARDGEMGAAEAAGALMDPELFGNAGETSGKQAADDAGRGGELWSDHSADESHAPGLHRSQEAQGVTGSWDLPEEARLEGRGEEGPPRFTCPVQELVAAVVPEEHAPMRDALSEALRLRRAVGAGGGGGAGGSNGRR